jgi:hypothetical protein
METIGEKFDLKLTDSLLFIENNVILNGGNENSVSFQNQESPKNIKLNLKEFLNL